MPSRPVGGRLLRSLACLLAAPAVGQALTRREATTMWQRQYIKNYKKVMHMHFSEKRYERMNYRRCGKSGLLLPLLSLGLWHNFGAETDYPTAREIVCRTFDHGITHFDLANNYGPPPGSAEVTFGKILREELRQHRDELIISTKAGYRMWPGPYGEWGSRKYLLASLDQSLQRMGLDYVDIFYSHRFDPDTPLEETMEALAQAMRQGKALYVGISNYGAAETTAAARLLRECGVRLLLHQPSFSLLNRWIQTEGLLDVLEQEGLGCAVFSPLQQGILTDKYLKGIPPDSRAAKKNGYVELRAEVITPTLREKLLRLNQLAKRRGQSLAQMALAWTLRDPRVTTAIVGVRTPAQLQDNLNTLQKLDFSPEELQEIETIIASN
ncbi:MAG: L-glyceraldehyde 3-phosphate reductase [Calditrichia bacterium]